MLNRGYQHYPRTVSSVCFFACFLDASSHTFRFFNPGYERRYYQHKFSLAHDDLKARGKLVEIFCTAEALLITFVSITHCRVVAAYVQGLIWIFNYYFQGVSIKDPYVDGRLT